VSFPWKVLVTSIIGCVVLRIIFPVDDGAFLVSAFIYGALLPVLDKVLDLGLTK